MKSILKAGIFAAGLLAALFQAGCASSSKDLTPSQKTGAGYSPAVLFQVSVTGNAKDYDAEEIAEKVNYVFHCHPKRNIISLRKI